MSTAPAPLPKESKEAYAAFTVYCTLDPFERSLQAVSKKVGKASSLIERWSSGNDWVARTAEFDRVEDEAEAEREKAKWEKVNQQHITVATAAVLTHAVGLQAIARRLQESRAALKRMDIQKLFHLGIRAAKATASTGRAIRKTLSEAKEWNLDLNKKSSENPSPLEPEPAVEECRCRKNHEVDVNRMPCEQPAAYEAFQVYCRESNRSISQIADLCMTSPRQIRRWMERYQWKIRSAWLRADQHQSEPEPNDGEAEPEVDRSSLIMVRECMCEHPHEIDYHRFPCETSRAFAAFGVYRDLGEKRSIRRTAAACGTVASQVQKWAQRHQWSARARIFDAECKPSVEGVELEQLRKKLLEALHNAEAAQAVAMQILSMNVRRAKELENIDIRDLLGLALLAASNLKVVQRAELEAHASLLGAKLRRVGEKTYLDTSGSGGLRLHMNSMSRHGGV